MNKISKLVLISVFFIGAAMPAFAETSTTTASSLSDLISTLQQQIATLNAQIKALKDAQAAVAQAGQNVNSTLKLIKQLRQGMAGDDVKLLQTILSADPEIYPEGLISGFYGKFTAEAVKRFQKKHDLENVGQVGPKTLEKLNEFLDEHPLATTTDNVLPEAANSEKEEWCAIIPPGHVIAPGWLRKHDGEKPIVPECQTLPKGIEDVEKGTNGATSTKKDNEENDKDNEENDRESSVSNATSTINATSTDH